MDNNIIAIEKRRGIKATVDKIVFNVIAYIVVGISALIAIVPFFILVINSFATEHAVLFYGFAFLPREWGIEAYKLIFQYPQNILNAYGISILVTVAGTAVNLLISSMAAYVLFNKSVKYRNQMAFFLYFTTLFNGGLVPYYMLITSVLHLKDTIFVLILTQLVNVWYLLILRNFLCGTIPDSLVESAKIDGAGHFRIYAQIILPLSKPALASIGMFIALGYWGDWWSSMMFIDKQSLYPLQFLLYQMLSNVQFAATMVNIPAVSNHPTETLKLAMAVVATGPIIFLYPFVQRYFVAGITIGAVKG